MSARTDLQEKVDQYLTERHLLGFELRTMGPVLASFARYVADSRHQGPMTSEVMADWARQDKKNGSSDQREARRLKLLRPFCRWLRQFEPLTEVPNESVFGPVPGRVAPHIYRDAEIVELLAAARSLSPQGGLRPAVYETLFGLLASTGLRISEALSLMDSDVDLKKATLTVRETKFAKTRLLPLHPSTISALAHYRTCRRRYLKVTASMPFFVSTRGKRLGKHLGDRQVHRIFIQLRDQLHWPDRGAHGGPRIHDLRHSFAVRRVRLWHEKGIDVDQAMLSLSTYMGHVKISNTYWYLTSVPELMAIAGDKFERFAETMELGDE